MNSSLIYDYVIIGSGPAGCACACAILESTEAANTGSLGSLHTCTVAILEEAGPSEVIFAANCEPEVSACHTAEGASWCVCDDRCYVPTVPDGHAFSGCLWAGRGSALGGGSAVNAGFYVDDHDYWDEIWCPALAGADTTNNPSEATSITNAWSSTELSRCSAEVLFRLGMKSDPLPTNIYLPSDFTALRATEAATTATKTVSRTRGGDAAEAFLSACNVVNESSSHAGSPDLPILASLPSALSSISPSAATADTGNQRNATRSIENSGKEAQYISPGVFDEPSTITLRTHTTTEMDSISRHNSYRSFTVSGVTQSTLANGQRRTAADLLRPILLAQEGKHGQAPTSPDVRAAASLDATAANTSGVTPRHGATLAAAFVSKEESHRSGGNTSWSSSSNNYSSSSCSSTSKTKLTVLSGAGAAKLLWRDSNCGRNGDLWEVCGVELVDGREVSARCGVVVACGPEPTVRLLFHSGCACTNADEAEHEVIFATVARDDAEPVDKLSENGDTKRGRSSHVPSPKESTSEQQQGQPEDALRELPEDKQRQHDQQNRQRRRLYVPGLGQRVFDHPTVFEPMFGLMATLPPEVPKYQAASINSDGGVVTQLSLVTEQGFAPFCRLLGRDISPNHSTITAPLRWLFRAFLWVANGPAVARGDGRGVHCNRINDATGIHSDTNPKIDGSKRHSTDENSISQRGFLNEWMRCGRVGISLWRGLWHQQGLGWACGYEPLSFGAVFGTLNTPLTCCSLRLPPKGGCRPYQKPLSAASEELLMGKWRQQPLLSDSPPLAAVDVARLLLLSRDCRRVAREVRAAQRKAFLQYACDACGIPSDCIGNSSNNGIKKEKDSGSASSSSTSAWTSIKTKWVHLLRRIWVGFVGASHDALCGTVQWLLVVLGLAIPPEEDEKDSSKRQSSPNESNKRDREDEKLAKSNMGEDDRKNYDDADGHDDVNDYSDDFVQDEQLKSHVKACCGTLWHSLGGCGVGTSLEGSTLRLVGTRNVHVCGAASFPAPVRCNPMGACYAQGWRLGELLGQHHLTSTV